ncbi:hypothetical protein EVAR_10900_1 [Eumeta japonica]|uniref:Uncharacterized protein n=1 Tax=Eumeta variegata TaxID=151549 RepID=A0A4C1UTD7_EUMVA|nr:hypothetical protein EVAR_10900_1 [Eumeta japonica]
MRLERTNFELIVQHHLEFVGYSPTSHLKWEGISTSFSKGIVFGFIGETHGAVVEKTKDETAPEIDGIVGVSSIAGIASRNGRFSTIRDVQFYPSLSTVVRKDDGKSTTVSAKGKNGIQLSGSSQIYPDADAVVVSAHAGSFLGRPNTPLTSTNVLIPDEIIRIPHHAWFPSEIFDHMVQANMNAPDARKHWTVPKFNPFISFWR